MNGRRKEIYFIFGAKPPQNQPTLSLHKTSRHCPSTKSADTVPPQNQPTLSLHKTNRHCPSTKPADTVPPQNQPTLSLHKTSRHCPSTKPADTVPPQNQPTLSLHKTSRHYPSTKPADTVPPQNQPTLSLHKTSRHCPSTKPADTIPPQNQRTLSLHKTSRHSPSTKSADSVPPQNQPTLSLHKISRLCPSTKPADTVPPQNQPTLSLHKTSRHCPSTKPADTVPPQNQPTYKYAANKLDNVRKSAKTYGSIREEILSWDLWRATFAEFLATFLFVFAGCASVSSQPTNVVQISLCFGLGIMAMVQMVGHISGGHINPAVTIAMAIVFNITPLRALFYIIAQCLGAIVGAFFLKGVSLPGAGLGVTSLKGINAGQGFAVELFLTFVLVAVIFATTDPNRTHFGNASIAIGLTVTLSHLAAIHLTGSSINPARSLGSAAAANYWEYHWFQKTVKDALEELFEKSKSPEQKAVVSNLFTNNSCCGIEKPEDVDKYNFRCDNMDWPGCYTKVKEIIEINLPTAIGIAIVIIVVQSLTTELLSHVPVPATDDQPGLARVQLSEEQQEWKLTQNVEQHITTNFS
ncbi:aquaporin-like [Octopus vulgaris]|uniref:Aquaporin-like n=1 Tax=Octopus vulgaris TaxID=6645 RepID=A0AA36AMQ2_OCTVU|nr:aquaporin-like [Octopus vulgaris]